MLLVNIVDGGILVIVIEDVISVMCMVLVIVVGVDSLEFLFVVVNGMVILMVDWYFECVVDYIGVIVMFGELLVFSFINVFDVFVGFCWLVVFVVIGLVVIDIGELVVEGLLSLVYLDYVVCVVGQLFMVLV